MSWLWLSLLGAVVVAALTYWLLRVQAVRNARAQAQRMHEARVKAMKLVIDFEHTPVRGASRDRTLSGKARRQARRG
jgi:uncharacterized membrane protein YccC